MKNNTTKEFFTLFEDVKTSPRTRGMYNQNENEMIQIIHTMACSIE